MQTFSWIHRAILAVALAAVAVTMTACGGGVVLATPPPGKLAFVPATVNFPDTQVGTKDEVLQPLEIVNVGSVPVVLSALSISGTNAADFQLIPGPDCSNVLSGNVCHVLFKFVPGGLDSRTATLTVASDAVGSPQTVQLTGKGIAGVLALSPSPMAFPGTPVGGTSTQKLTLTNIGSNRITLGPFSTTGSSAADFSVTDTSCAINFDPGVSCEFTIQFAPTALGPRSATFTVTSDAFNNPQSVTLSGSGTVGIKALTLTPNPMNFPGTPVGGTSSAQRLTITNTGNVPVVVNGSRQGGANFSEFNFGGVTSCGSNLLPGTSCGTDISFSPAALGPRSATFTITSDAADQTLTLTGSGIVPTKTLTVTPNILNFPDTPVGGFSTHQTVTITNTGNTTVTASTASVDGNVSDFGFFKGLLPTDCISLSPRSSCTLEFGFGPQKLGLRTAIYSFISDATGSPSTVALTGAGVAPTKVLTLTPDPLNFPDTGVGGSSAPLTLAVANVGNSSVTFDSIIFSGANFSDFSTTTCPVTILSGTVCNIFITFSPTAVGPRTATATVVSDAAGSPQSVTLSGNGVALSRLLTVTPDPVVFPDENVGGPFGASVGVVTISNRGNVMLTITGAALGGANPSDFLSSKGVASCNGPIAPGTDCTIPFVFTPSALGSREANFTVTSDASSSPQSVKFVGNGVAPGLLLTVAPAVSNFPNTAVGSTSAAQAIKIINSGSGTINISSTALSGANAGDFTPSGGGACIGPLAKGAICTLNYTFSPTAIGARKASLTVTSDGVGSPQSVTFQGNGISTGKLLTLSPSSLDFLSTGVGGTSPAKIITISNTGTGTVTISNTALGGTNPGDFSKTSGGACTAVLAQGASCTVTLVFAPIALGARAANLTVTSDAAGSPQSIALSGSALSGTKLLAVSPNPLIFADEHIGGPFGSVGALATISNVGAATVNISTLSLGGANPGDFFPFAGLTICNGPLAPGANCPVSFIFTPSAVGPRSAQLIVNSDAPASPQSVTLIGNGVPAASIANLLGITVMPMNPTIPAGSTQQFSATGTYDDGTLKDLTNSISVGWNSGTPATATINSTGLASATSPGTTTIRAFTGTVDGSTLLTVVAAAKVLTITPNPVTFSSTTVGSTSPAELLTTTNTGTAAAVISSVTITGPNAGDFAFASFGDCFVTPLPVTAPPGAICTARITFTPTAPGPRTASVTITSDAVGSPQTVTLTGNGIVVKALTLAPSSLNFPDTLVGNISGSKNITITNTGTSAVNISSIALTGVNSGDYSITANSCPATLSTNCTVSVAFTPTATGARSASLTVTSDGTGSPQSVPLSGKGIVPATFSIGGTITGLTHSGLVLANGADTVSPLANAISFVFSVKLATGTTYNVTVKTQPIAETCTVSNSSSTVGTADVTNVAVDCLPNTPAWVWKNGSDRSPAGPVYGTQGTPAPTNVPGRRDHAVSWTDISGNLWLFGGRAADSQLAVGANNDLWRYRPSNNDWTWMSGSNVGGASGVYGTKGTSTPGNVAGARQSSMSWADGSGNLWLFGGSGPDALGTFRRLNDLWQYNPGTGQWTWMSGSSFGFDNGTYGTKGIPDLLNVPGQREAGVTWTDAAGNLWLFGGEGFAAPPVGSGSSNSSGLLADLWRYSPIAERWTWMSGSNVASNAGGAVGVYGTRGIPSATNAPGHRREAVSWSDTSGNLWLFGGVGFDSNGNSGLLNDLWKYDLTTGEWTWMSGSSTINATPVFGTKGVPASTNVPDARQLAIGWADKDNNLWLFGGANARVLGVTGFVNDLWQYNIATGEWTWISGSSGVNASGVYGTLGTAASTNAPGGRSGGVGWIDASGNLWQFGGLGVDSAGSTDFMNDLWMYSR